MKLSASFERCNWGLILGSIFRKCDWQDNDNNFSDSAVNMFVTRAVGIRDTSEKIISSDNTGLRGCVRAPEISNQGTFMWFCTAFELQILRNTMVMSCNDIVGQHVQTIKYWRRKYDILIEIGLCKMRPYADSDTRTNANDGKTLQGALGTCDTECGLR